MDENKSGLYIVAIVGVIAVVALVVLVTSAGRERVVYSGTTDTLTAVTDASGEVYYALVPGDTSLRKSLCIQNGGTWSGAVTDPSASCKYALKGLQ